MFSSIGQQRPRTKMAMRDNIAPRSECKYRRTGYDSDRTYTSKLSTCRELRWKWKFPKTGGPKCRPPQLLQSLLSGPQKLTHHLQNPGKCFKGPSLPPNPPERVSVRQRLHHLPRVFWRLLKTKDIETLGIHGFYGTHNP